MDYLEEMKDDLIEQALDYYEAAQEENYVYKTIHDYVNLVKRYGTEHIEKLTKEVYADRSRREAA